MKPLGTLRFLLAFAVLYAHSFSVLWPALPAWAWNTGNLASQIGVLMFFTLSGYIICFTVDRWYAARPAAFLVNRALRIYPTHIACYCLALLILWSSPIMGDFGTIPRISRDGLTPAGFIEALLILPSAGYFMNPPIWTVQIELWFYLFIGASIFFRRQAAILWTAGMLVSGITIFRLNPAPWLIDFSFDGHGYLFSFFALGAAIYYKRSRMAWMVIAAALAAVVVYLYKIFPGSAADHNQLMIAFLVVLGAMVVLEQRSNASRADGFLGDLSYPLYACHVPLLAFAAPGKAGLEDWALVCSLCIGVAIALRFIVELPLSSLRAKLRFRTSLPPVEAAPSPPHLYG